ncbi:MAG TPA: DUF6538 domain-containing protein [Microvirga sp.]|jgi:hypothetical protein|nr:DUF6538 domain-containing protein [Microvirga sp.]
MRYIQASRHGVFKYRRVIPPELQKAAGRREFVQSLNTKDAAEAELRALKVHRDVEAWLRALKITAGPLDRTRAFSDQLTSVDDWYRGLGFLKTLGLPLIATEDLTRDQWELREGLLIEKLRIDFSNTRTRDAEIARSPEARALLGSLERPDPTLSEALEVYLRHHKDRFAALPPKEERHTTNVAKRSMHYLSEAIGEDHTIGSLTRENVRTFADYLRARGLKPASIKKAIKIAGAVVQVSLDEFGINTRNPFHRFTVADPVPVT